MPRILPIASMADVHVTVNPQDLANAEFAFARSGGNFITAC